MSRKNAIFRKSLSKRNTRKPKNLVVFRYGVIDSKHKAKGYCLNHNCFISGKDLQEKNCNYKHCKHFCKEFLQFG